MTTRRYKRYPTYKDSGVEWMSEIPAGWEIKRLRYVAELNPSPSKGSRLSADTEVSFVPMESIEEYGGIDLAQTKSFGDVGSGYTYFADGDVVIAKITPCFENGKGALATGLVNGVAYGTTELHVMRCQDVAVPRYLFYVTISDAFRRLGQAEMYGAGGQKRVPEAFIKDLKHGIPPVPEQKTIATFLDRETARINTLVAKKDRLIELLQERRAALITHAVTMGRDSGIRMNHSGIEWLGKIPRHWETKRLTLLFREKDERGFPHLPLLNVSISQGVTLREFSEEHIEQQAQDWNTYKRAKQGDIAFNKMRMWQGAVGVVPVDGLVSPDYTVAEPFEGVNPFYFEGLFRTSSFLIEVDRRSHGIVKDRNRLYWDDFRQIKVPVPPPHEQDAIVSSFREDAHKIDNLVAKVREAIDRLKEYRAALISAAVTGKIDVREEVE